ncbi:MAG: beta-propeller domain-containing protein [Nannocystaceae bacterium]|nr:beta-propeller domain-containing protein [bacterium]
MLFDRPLLLLAFACLLACDSSGAEPEAAPAPAPETAEAAPTQDEAPEVPPAQSDAVALEPFADAKAIGKLLEERHENRVRGYGGGSGTGSGYGAGGLGLSGTGMGGGGTGEGTIGLGSLGYMDAPTAAAESDEITNTQVEGVDEGGIIKVHGDHLVVLRRGRLFTTRVGDDSLEPIASVDVGPKGRHQAWYDEMLVHGDEVIVIGYSYANRGTELARFDIGKDGSLEHTVTDILRSNDYYSSRNYTSRLIGDTLVFYMPHSLGRTWPEDDAKPDGAPALCRTKNAKCDEWKGVVKSNKVYKPADGGSADVLHTVITCDLSKGSEEMRCEGRGILGPYSRNFYVSADAVYVWVNDPSWSPAPPWAQRKGPPSDAIVYRLGLRDESVAALRTYGAPVDQFSFSQTPDGHLNVLVRSAGAGGGMWGSELNPSHDVALLRSPLSAFEPGRLAHASEGHYVDLPDPAGSGYAFHNRFVADALLYGVGAGWGKPIEGKTPLYVHRLGGETTTLQLEHPVDRIEPMGTNAVVVGASGNDLHFAAVALGDTPKAAGTYVHEGANQGETRSHGFFYRPTGATTGLLGLPVRRGGSSTSFQLTGGSAEVLYLGVDTLKFEALGTLEANPKANRGDRCKVSCVDWYGNARPVFLGDRVLALLGYELVEGQRTGDTFSETRRANMLDALPTR